MIEVSPDLNKALRVVQDRDPDNYTYIFGRAMVIDQVLDQIEYSHAFIAEADESRLQFGLMGRYRGVPIVKWSNWKEYPFPANLLLVFQSPDWFFGEIALGREKSLKTKIYLSAVNPLSNHERIVDEDL